MSTCSCTQRETPPLTLARLIMLLIQSDFIKSAAFVVFPIVSLVTGPIPSDSHFCQASGFVLALGIESSDIAVLLIAIHSVMYIFKPQSGLHPYRREAYLAYYMLPVAIASMAFIDGLGYENLGHYCYLRADRGWRRMALSWIPRYVIGIGIMVIYAFIYIYIRRRIYDYGRRSSGELQSSTPRRQLPRISYHGLAPSVANSRRESATDCILPKPPRRSASTGSSVHNDDNTTTPQSHRAFLASRSPMDWNWSGFRQPRSSQEDSLPDDTHDPLSPNLTVVEKPPAACLPERNPQPEPPSGRSSHTAGHRPISSPGPGNAGTADHHPAHCPSVSPPNILTTPPRGSPTQTSEQHRPQEKERWSRCRYHSSLRRTYTEPSSPIVISPVRGDDANSSDGDVVTRNRDKMRRQLLSLFAYPLVYMIVWVFPFVSHAMGYDDAVRSGDPLWLLILGIISLSVQGTVDCMLFAAREKPWRHARTHREVWKDVSGRLTGPRTWKEMMLGSLGFVTSGRTREEMIVEGRLARERRDEEARAEREQRGSRAAQQPRPVRQGRREWWDAEEAAIPV